MRKAGLVLLMLIMVISLMGRLYRKTARSTPHYSTHQAESLPWSEEIKVGNCLEVPLSGDYKGFMEITAKDEARHLYKMNMFLIAGEKNHYYFQKFLGENIGDPQQSLVARGIKKVAHCPQSGETMQHFTRTN